MGLGTFLLAWVGKHMLDRLLLPHMLDWWALRSKNKAVLRAEKLLDTLATVIADRTNPHRLIIDSTYIVMQLVMLTMIVNVGLLSLASIGTEIFRLAFGLGFELTLLMMVIGLHLAGKKDIQTATNPQKYRVETIERITRLLVSAGFDQKEIDDWLLKVPEIPQTSGKI